MKFKSDFLTLHFLVLLNSLVPTVVIGIDLHPLSIIFDRTLIATGLLAILLWVRGKGFRLSARQIAFIVFTGMLTSAYWFTFFLTAKISNASVALVTLATSSLWIGFLSPLFFLTPIKFNQIILGLNALFGMYIIHSDDFVYGTGFYLGLGSAVLGAIVTIFSSKFSKVYDSQTIAFYQMLGAWLGTCLYLPILKSLDPSANIALMPDRIQDALAIFGLAAVFSVFAYSALIRVLKTVSPFVVSLTSNLSPLYGIVIALIINGKSEIMSIYFYSGSIIIIASIFVVPLARYYFSESTPRQTRIA